MNEDLVAYVVLFAAWTWGAWLSGRASHSEKLEDLPVLLFLMPCIATAIAIIVLFVAISTEPAL